MIKQKEGDSARRTIVEGFSNELTKLDLKILLEDQFPRSTSISFQIEKGACVGNITTRLLGTDTGRDVLFYTAQQIDGVKSQMQLAAARPPENA